MSSLTRRVLSSIRAHDLLAAGDRVVVAISGGADSVALTRLLAELSAGVGFTVVALAHLHHGLRVEADADEAFCRDLARRFGVPFEVEHVDVGASARDARESVETAGRRLRYRFLESVADRYQADRIAVAHTLDDQAETVLLNLLRGTGTIGLGGMRRRRGRIVRPLLDVDRAAIEAYLGSVGQAWRTDATNADVRFARNRLRREVMPVLRERFSQQIAAGLGRTAAIAREDDEVLDRLATQVGSGIVQRDRDRVLIDVAALGAQSLGLRRRIVRDALRQHAGAREVGFRHVEAVLAAAARARTGAVLDLPGQRMRTLPGLLALEASGDAVRGRRPTGAEGPGVSRLPVPGSVAIPWAALSVSAKVVSDELIRSTARGYEVTVDLAACGTALGVRRRAQGDVLRPLGLGGRKKLQDVFVDRKVPREERDRVPLVVDASGRIVWVVGHAVSEDFRVRGQRQPVIILIARAIPPSEDPV